MRLKTLELSGFKSFSKKTILEFKNPIVCIVGPNGSGKSNVVEAIRFVLGEQSMKSMRGKSGSDMIFKGSKNLAKGNRAAVTIHFNNTDKVFKLENEGRENINLNYDGISISREVFSDGMNKYILNGEEVRLKDIHNLLGSVNIGSSGHHIISQGEADRILNANLKERREMVEDALGLKIFQYKIKESVRKLERTEENMKEVGLMRRENAPHLNFLKRQVEKFERAKEMQTELAVLYREYFKKESVYLENEKSVLSTEKNKISGELQDVADKISAIENADSLRSDPGRSTSPLPGGRKSGGNIEELKIIEQQLNEVRGSKSELERALGRIEGAIEAKQEKIQVSGRCPTCGRELSEMGQEQIDNRQKNEQELTELKNSQAEITLQIGEIENQEKEFTAKIETLKRAISQEMEALRDLEREKFGFRVKHQELSSALELLHIQEVNLKSLTGAFENEVKEGVALIGPAILSFQDYEIKEESEHNTQQDLKKKIERLKIKLEDAGMGGVQEVIKEFQEVTERDSFLAKEMEDLSKSIEALKKLIADLKDKIDLEFKEGVKKINKEFQEFFSLMFGGGTGSLKIVNIFPRNESEELSDEVQFEPDSDAGLERAMPEMGLEINVSLPQKKVKELQALSGGERSLTSIALLFAMSQVNPPPFLVLDETDAALDEANSRKYGDMLEKLSQHSQLVVVTHNRETMSRAGVLYGVTIGADDTSKLLSVKFDEAVAIAK